MRKFCSDCKHSEKESVMVGPQQMRLILVCGHGDLRDPVDGGRVPCALARKEEILCGYKGKHFEASKGEQDNNTVITLPR